MKLYYYKCINQIRGISEAHSYSYMNSCFIILFCVLLNNIALAIPVGGKKDLFLADKSPKALAFREASKQAREEYARLDPLPEGLNGEEQRKRVIEKFENAVEIMPEAPPAPELLLKIASLWNSPAVAPEEPDKAIEVYKRITDSYPKAHKAILKSFSGLSYSYCLKQEYDKAADWAEAILKYELPSNSEKELVDFYENLRQETLRNLASYNAAVLGFYIVDGEFVSHGVDIREVQDEAIESMDRDNNYGKGNIIASNKDSKVKNHVSITAKDNTVQKSDSASLPICTLGSSGERTAYFSFYKIFIPSIILSIAGGIYVFMVFKKRSHLNKDTA